MTKSLENNARITALVVLPKQQTVQLRVCQPGTGGMMSGHNYHSVDLTTNTPTCDLIEPQNIHLTSQNRIVAQACLGCCFIGQCTALDFSALQELKSNLPSLTI
jgi:hypothetical protein